ncbi:MAG TPA: ATP-dependent DNA helicase RecG [Candidatus Binatia bacterium]
MPSKPVAASPKDCFRALLTPLRFLKGIGPTRAEQLEGLGLKTVEDLLYHLPFRYEDRRAIRKIRQATVGREETFIGKLAAVSQRYVPKMRRRILTATLADETGLIGLVWYRVPPYMAQGLQKGRLLLVHGKVEPGIGAQKKIVHPEFEALDPEDQGDKEKVLPIYLRPAGIPLRTMRRWMIEALEKYAGYLPGFLPDSLVKKQGLVDLTRAMREVHRPEKTADLAALNGFASAAHRAIVFDEFFYLQLGLALRRKRRAAENGIAFGGEKKTLTRKMWEMLPFALTRAQEKVLREISLDMAAARPMQRLLQGDVGSGKTIVGWFAALRAIENGFQALWMAPTELLAEQHYLNLKGFAERLGVSAALLTGSLAARAKSEIVDKMKTGAIHFVVGTHALIQEEIQVPRLGLGIIDEQHRFGVMQRMALQRLAACRGADRSSAVSSVEPQPDILLMSATPIPRSLAMVLYGDLEVSSLNEMPPGRTPVETRLVRESQRARLYDLVRAEIQQGRQAYVVYPLVEASERLPVRDATGMAQELSQEAFKEFRVGLLHGRMSGGEKDEVMRRFKDGALEILVATTVIEVGIDVPNATIMVVEHAERFGLSQLHQLRGRVGRGRHRSQCLLVYYGSNRSEALARLRVMEKEHDGFKIAEADLRLRGPGEMLGTRQAGLADFRLANLLRDASVLLDARQEALAWLETDPHLARPESRALKAVLKHRWGGRLELGSIG